MVAGVFSSLQELFILTG